MASTSGSVADGGSAVNARGALRQFVARDGCDAREFLLGAIDEEVPLQVALGTVVGAMGVKEFAAKVGSP
jgi:hypothetical protein